MRAVEPPCPPRWRWTSWWTRSRRRPACATGDSRSGAASPKAGPFWSRPDRVFRQGRELTVIREVLSPDLERWLAPASALNPEDIPHMVTTQNNSGLPN
ncbi:MAG: chorismate pyruvate-lyase family protein [Cyanobacteriota bacterium]|nr:chorismate pyruvate-lyase family protein [Cyanobacteriota bacterium]